MAKLESGVSGSTSWTKMAKSKQKESSGKKGLERLHDYQLEGIERLLSMSFAGLFWDPGLGKTVTVLAAFDLLKKEGIVNQLFVIASRRIIHGVWPLEIKEWGFPFSVAIIHGSEKKRLEALNSGADVLLINYENVSWLLGGPKKKGKLKRGSLMNAMLTIDESSKFRNTKNNRFRSLRKHLSRFKRRIILTGTPAPNGLLNLFGQMFIVDRGESLGQYITAYRLKYFYPSGYMGYDWKLQPDAEQDIYKAISHRILRFGRDKLKLPAIKFVDILIDIEEKERRMYESLKEDLIAEFKKGLITAANAAVASGKLRQIVNGGIYEHVEGEEDSRAKRITHVVHHCKDEALIELLEELSGHPALIAYEFNHDKERINKALLESKNLKTLCPKDKKGVRYVPYIGAGTTDKEADAYIAAWNKGELPILLGHPASMAHGLNMQSLNANVIFYGLTWDLEQYEQFIQRVWRQGQKSTVFVYRLIVRDSIDEAVTKALKKKSVTQNDLLKALEELCMSKKKSDSQGDMKILTDTLAKTGSLTKYDAEDENFGVENVVSFIFRRVGAWSPDEHKEFHKSAGIKTDAEKIGVLFNKTTEWIIKLLAAKEVDGKYEIANEELIIFHWPERAKSRRPKEMATNGNGKTGFGSNSSKKKTGKKVDPKKAIKKVTSKKKVASKKATSKKTASKKTASKKTASKKTASKSNGSRSSRITEETKLKVVKQFDKGVRQQVTLLLKKKAMTYSDLCAAAKKSHGFTVAKMAGYVSWLRRNGHISIVN